MLQLDLGMVLGSLPHLGVVSGESPRLGVVRARSWRNLGPWITPGPCLAPNFFSLSIPERTQVNRINRGKQKMPHTGGSKSIATLMDELELIEERLRNDQHQSNEQSNNDVAWEGDLYSQVLGSDKSGYVRGLGLGPTPSLLWGNKASFGKFASDILANEIAQKLEQEIKMLKEKHEEEIKLMKENQDKMLIELSCMRQILCRFVSTSSSMARDFNENSFMQASQTRLVRDSVTFVRTREKDRRSGTQTSYECERRTFLSTRSVIRACNHVKNTEYGTRVVLPTS
ncbi:hypothetical protein PIB30_073317 [Stylosanthes scabra]|uniref:Uncharacterized protein n=1 Tax=Stylosanthes scabra TaxID=79078 RepID=A0ABU6RPR4_9FABA|nr:hypothetical protein [Stylosanthes scabra]